MHPTRTLARPMLGSVFVTSGIDVLRNPAPQAAKAEPVISGLAPRLGLPEDPKFLVRANAAVQVVAGSLLSIGKLRRLSTAALMVSLVPTTLAGHRFWEAENDKEKKEQRTHLTKNVAVLGGLLLELVDTEGRPSLAWKSRRAVRRGAQAAGAASELAKGSKKVAKGAVVVKGAEMLRRSASDAAAIAKGTSRAAA